MQALNTKHRRPHSARGRRVERLKARLEQERDERIRGAIIAQLQPSIRTGRGRMLRFMKRAIHLPVRDPDEPLNAKSIGELPTFLEDPDERAICREYLAWIKSVQPQLFTTVGRAELALEVLEPPDRKHLLEHLRRMAGLDSTREVQEAEAQHLALMHVHDRHEPVLRVMPGGAIVDVAQAARERRPSDRARQAGPRLAKYSSPRPRKPPRPSASNRRRGRRTSAITRLPASGRRDRLTARQGDCLA